MLVPPDSPYCARLASRLFFITLEAEPPLTISTLSPLWFCPEHPGSLVLLTRAKPLMRPYTLKGSRYLPGRFNSDVYRQRGYLRFESLPRNRSLARSSSSPVLPHMVPAVRISPYIINLHSMARVK